MQPAVLLEEFLTAVRPRGAAWQKSGMKGTAMTSPGDTATETPASSDISAAAEEFKQRVGSMADRAGEVAQRAREQAAAAASDLVQPMKEKARAIAEEQKQAGAERLDGMARAIHQAADRLEQDLPPQAGTYIHQAAEGIEQVSSAIRDRSVGDLLGMVESFARRQPAAFFGGAVLTGFVLSRFLKSSAESRPPGTSAGGAPASYEPARVGGAMYGVPAGESSSAGVNPGMTGPTMPK